MVIAAYSLLFALSLIMPVGYFWSAQRRRNEVWLCSLYVCICVVNLGYLLLSLSKTVAFAGSVLNIKPVLAVIDGEILMLGKARGSKQGNNLLVQEIQKAGGADFGKPVLLGYTGITDVLLQKYRTDSAALWQDHRDDLPCTIVGSVVGTHAGPGAVAVAFFSAE